MVAWVFPDFELMWLAEETKKNLPRELDFSQEAQNAERVADMFKHFAWLRVRSTLLIKCCPVTLSVVKPVSTFNLHIQGVRDQFDTFCFHDTTKLFENFLFSLCFQETAPRPAHAVLSAAITLPLPSHQVPKVRWDLTTSRVLTMEYCDGGQVNDPDYLRRHGIAPREVSQKLGKLYSEMIFEKG